MNLTFEAFRTRKKEWRWRLRAANGKIIANSGESYRRRIDCMAAIRMVKQSDLAGMAGGK